MDSGSRTREAGTQVGAQGVGVRPGSQQRPRKHSQGCRMRHTNRSAPAACIPTSSNERTSCRPSSPPQSNQLPTRSRTASTIESGNHRATQASRHPPQLAFGTRHSNTTAAGHASCTGRGHPASHPDPSTAHLQHAREERPHAGRDLGRKVGQVGGQLHDLQGRNTGGADKS